MRARGTKLARLALLPAAIAAMALTGCGGEDGQGAGGADWPMPGRTPARTSDLTLAGEALDPPLRQAWSFDLRESIEFPPAIANGVAYLANRYGNVQAIRLSDGELLWKRAPNPRETFPRVDATEPVYAEGLLFLGLQVGEMLALDATDGEEAWRREYTHLEFSPVVGGGLLYYGVEETELIAANASDGTPRWSFHAPGPLTGGFSFHRGRLYLGAEEGILICLEGKTGRVLWRAGTNGIDPHGEVNFHAPASIAFGLTYAVRSDGRAFAFDQRTGKVAWTSRAHGAHEYLLSPPAAAKAPDGSPTLYLGSADGHLYALDALTGKLEWRQGIGAPAIGPVSLIGRTAYLLSGPPARLVGIDLRSRERTLARPDSFLAPTSEGAAVYLVDSSRLLRLDPYRP